MRTLSLTLEFLLDLAVTVAVPFFSARILPLESTFSTFLFEDVHLSLYFLYFFDILYFTFSDVPLAMFLTALTLVKLSLPAEAAYDGSMGDIMNKTAAASSRMMVFFLIDTLDVLITPRSFPLFAVFFCQDPCYIYP